ncbi:hypothetical protein [Aliiroseovarius crassostreae]|uniref:hypothetical protein n=1 Tax=Aliiroseovarius crassostreae TaxID=154981 RepID=UPI003C7C940A
MSVLIETYQNVKPIGRDNDGPELTHTRWGYMITSQDAGGIATRAGYLVVRYFGIVMALVAIGLWIAPGTSVHPEVLPLKLGVSALFFIVGAVAVWGSGNDRRDEMQVDLERQEFRRGIRRANGRFVSLVELPLRDAGELFVTRGLQNAGEAVLYIRRKSAPQALEIAAGPEDLLLPLQQRVAKDLRHYTHEAAA